MPGSPDRRGKTRWRRPRDEWISHRQLGCMARVAQFITDDGQAWIAERALLAADDPDHIPWYRGYIDHIVIQDNRFCGNLYKSGINLYQVNWGWVGWNVVDDLDTLGNPDNYGLGLINATNSWLYGNRVANTKRGVFVLGSSYLLGAENPQSLYGACFNGLGWYFKEHAAAGEQKYYQWPNTYHTSSCSGAASGPVIYGSDHCYFGNRQPACFDSDAAAQGY
jgi:hypothetical protein